MDLDPIEWLGLIILAAILVGMAYIVFNWATLRVSEGADDADWRKWRDGKHD